jgi:hypothetical protein
MQAKRMAASPAAEDLKELADPDDFPQRDNIERAVRELVNGGLLFRCSGAVLPTRTALRAYELFIGAA